MGVLKKHIDDIAAEMREDNCDEEVIEIVEGYFWLGAESLDYEIRNAVADFLLAEKKEGVNPLYVYWELSAEIQAQRAIERAQLEADDEC